MNDERKTSAALPAGLQYGRLCPLLRRWPRLRYQTPVDVEGKLRWCSLSLGGSTIMLQEFPNPAQDSWTREGKVGVGVSLCFLCEDAIAIYREVVSHGIEASEPEVGNSMWVTSLVDPDGYHLESERITDVAEDTKLSEVKG